MIHCSDSSMGEEREKVLQFLPSSVVILCTVVFSLITIGELSSHGMAYMPV